MNPKEVTTPPTMLTIKEAAKLTNLSEHFVRNLCRRHEICCVMAGRKYLINYEKLVEYLNAPPAPVAPQQYPYRIQP